MMWDRRMMRRARGRWKSSDGMIYAAWPVGRGRFGCAAMGGMVNDVGSQDSAAGARVKEEVGWYDIRGVAYRARAV